MFPLNFTIFGKWGFKKNTVSPFPSLAFHFFPLQHTKQVIREHRPANFFPLQINQSKWTLKVVRLKRRKIADAHIISFLVITFLIMCILRNVSTAFCWQGFTNQNTRTLFKNYYKVNFECSITINDYLEKTSHSVGKSSGPETQHQ